MSLEVWITDPRVAPTLSSEVYCLPSFLAGVLLHVMGDALGSVIVVVTAIIFYVKPLRPEDRCNWQCYIDPSLTVVMVIIILSSAFPLIKETAVILLQMVPKGVNMEELSKWPGSGGPLRLTHCSEGWDHTAPFEWWWWWWVLRSITEYHVMQACFMWDLIIHSQDHPRTKDLL